MNFMRLGLNECDFIQTERHACNEIGPLKGPIPSEKIEIRP